MLFYTIYQKGPEECGFAGYLEGIARLKKNPVLFNELMELLNLCRERIDFIDEPVNLGFDNGSNPMNIIWKLHRPIPAKYLKKTNKLIG